MLMKYMYVHFYYTYVQIILMFSTQIFIIIIITQINVKLIKIFFQYTDNCVLIFWVFYINKCQ